MGHFTEGYGVWGPGEAPSSQSSHEQAQQRLSCDDQHAHPAETASFGRVCRPAVIERPFDGSVEVDHPGVSEAAASWGVPPPEALAHEAAGHGGGQVVGL